MVFLETLHGVRALFKGFQTNLIMNLFMSNIGVTHHATLAPEKT